MKDGQKEGLQSERKKKKKSKKTEEKQELPEKSGKIRRSVKKARKYDTGSNLIR